MGCAHIVARCVVSSRNSILSSGAVSIDDDITIASDQGNIFSSNMPLHQNAKTLSSPSPNCTCNSKDLKPKRARARMRACNRTSARARGRACVRGQLGGWKGG